MRIDTAGSRLEVEAATPRYLRDVPRFHFTGETKASGDSSHQGFIKISLGAAQLMIEVGNNDPTASSARPNPAVETVKGVPLNRRLPETPTIVIDESTARSPAHQSTLVQARVDRLATASCLLGLFSHKRPSIRLKSLRAVNLIWRDLHVMRISHSE
jgi:hypothetical protein